MSVFAIAGIGVAAVLLGILACRLHPFMALLFGTLIVLLLTPETTWLRNELDKELVQVEVAQGDFVKVTKPIAPGSYLAWPRTAPAPNEMSIWELSYGVGDQASLVPLVPAAATEATATRPDRLVSREKYLLAKSNSARGRFGSVTKRLSSGLSGTFEKLGLSVAMAAIIGVCLLESGAATSLVHGVSRIFGVQRTAPTLLVSGFTLGVPIFFDTVFYLLLPLAKAFGRQRPGQGLLAIMSIIVGATMAHSLVPPTPGPLLVATRMGIPIGTMMLGGIIVGGTAACFGYLYSLWCNQTMEFRIAAAEPASQTSDDKSLAAAAVPASMPVALAALPLAIPLGCLGGIEIWKSFQAKSATASSATAASPSALMGWLDLLGDPGFVLMIAAIIAYIMLRKVSSAKKTLPLMTQAVADAGTILLLTCAGGAFGASLEQLRISEAVAQMSTGVISPHGLLFAAFFVTGLIRVAQGSATIAMITAVGIVAPFTQGQTLPFNPVYFALAIGCGSKLLPWMNDSGFWQVSTMTGLSTTQTLKTFSAALSLMGCVGFIVTLLGAYLLPLPLSPG